MSSVLRIGVIVGLVLIGLLLVVWRFQRRLIYLPLERRVPDVRATLPGAEGISFATADGLHLAGWFLPPGDAPARATFVVFNGNAGHRGFRAPLARRLAVAGHGVLLFDYRGYAENPGSPSEDGLLSDARGALAWLGARRDVDAGRIVYFGESLGSGVAVALAAEAPPAALVLRSPFTSMTDVGRLHYPFLPVQWLLADRYPSAARLARLDVPLLVIAGSQDRIVPPAMSRRLYDASPAVAKRWLVIAGADHNDFELLAGDRLIDAVLAFVGERLEAPTEPR